MNIIAILLIVFFFFAFSSYYRKTTSYSARKEWDEYVKRYRFYCPNHPDRVSDKPGFCPVCKTELLEHVNPRDVELKETPR